MRDALKAMGRTFVFVMVNHKIFVGMLFVLTAGHEFPLPDWLNTLLGLVMMWTILIWWLGES